MRERDRDARPEEPRQAQRGPSVTLLIFLLFPLVGLIAAGLMILTTRGPRSALEPTPLAVTLPPLPTPRQLMDEPAPDFELRTLDETTVRLSDYRGRIVFLNFWATWCVPCERELPTFEAFMAEQPDDGPIVLAVDIGETYDQVKAFIDERGIDGFPILLDARSEVANTYAIGPIPVTFVLDEAGVIRMAKYGEMTRDDLDDYVEALQN